VSDHSPAGYDAAFLEVPVPLPVPLGRANVRRLPYLHFTVLLDADRRLACVTGVNIEGGALRDLERTGDWDLDPRVAVADQAGPGLYVDNDLDRGHQVRRRDPGWGSVAVATKATEQTFVYPNAAPQASVFNQSKDLWVGLEDHVLHYADAQDLRVSVFTAPVLADGDPLYRGVRIPRRFWKVAAWASDGELRAAGFVLDQSSLIDLDEGAAVPPLGAFKTFQVPIAEIETLAGVDFGPLTPADVLSADDIRPPGEWNELKSRSDIRL
jgi:endonuclease G